MAGYTLFLVGFAAVGLFISTLTDVPVGAMAAATALAIGRLTTKDVLS